ncbi:MAG: hypothetical protein U9R49_07450 [Bacteroidota bacterium]|nr:hypothetical protein [Bacteroidota bacterium]
MSRFSDMPPQDGMELSETDMKKIMHVSMPISKETMPMDKAFWGSYFGMCTDKFDINWMISFGEDQEK